MEDLEVGDVVILASGGPAMTVADVLPWGEIFCLWFTPDRKCVGEVFNRCLLRRLHEQLEDAPTAPFYAPIGTPPLGYEVVDERASSMRPSSSEDRGAPPPLDDGLDEERPHR